MGKVFKKPFVKVEDCGDHYHIVSSFEKYEAIEFLLEYLRCEIGGLEDEKSNEKE